MCAIKCQAEIIKKLSYFRDTSISSTTIESVDETEQFDDFRTEWFVFYCYYYESEIKEQPFV